jgi:hypothetical protein
MVEIAPSPGWNLLIARILKRDTDGLNFDAILKKIEAEILSAPKRKQESTNCCLGKSAATFPNSPKSAWTIGERLGRFDKRPIPKGCTSTYAPEWIAAVLKRGR